MEKRKILFVIESLNGGGAEKILSVLVKNIDKNKFEISVCSVVDKGVYKNDIIGNSEYSFVLPDVDSLMPVVRKTLYPVLYKAVYKWLPSAWIMKYIEKDDYDIIIAFTEGFPTKLVASSKQKNAKKIAWVHIDLLNNPWTQKVGVFGSIEEEKENYDEFSQIIGVSENVIESFRKVYKPKSEVKVLYNPIDNNEILKKALSDSGCKMMMKKGINLVTVGRLEMQKGYDRLINVLARIKSEGIPFNLKILGDGSQRRDLEAMIKEKSLENEIELLGFNNNPYPYIKNADLFVCSSRSEGYSTVITESLILETPVFTTECSGMRELLKDGRLGMIVKNNTEDMYSGLKSLIVSRHKIKDYKDLIKEENNRFSIDKLMKPIEELLYL